MFKFSFIFLKILSICFSGLLQRFFSYQPFHRRACCFSVDLNQLKNLGGPVPPGGPVTFGGPSRMWKISGPSLLCADPWPATIFVAFFITFFLCAKTTIGPVRMGHDFRSNCRFRLRIYFLLGTHHYLIVVL